MWWKTQPACDAKVGYPHDDSVTFEGIHVFAIINKSWPAPHSGSPNDFNMGPVLLVPLRNQLLQKANMGSLSASWRQSVVENHHFDIRVIPKTTFSLSREIKHLA